VPGALSVRQQLAQIDAVARGVPIKALTTDSSRSTVVWTQRCSTQDSTATTPTRAISGSRSQATNSPTSSTLLRDPSTPRPGGARSARPQRHHHRARSSHLDAFRCCGHPNTCPWEGCIHGQPRSTQSHWYREAAAAAWVRRGRPARRGRRMPSAAKLREVARAGGSPRPTMASRRRRPLAPVTAA
jgi:hypothetical protein